jgi:uncharacterized protein YqgC (DUF456 family)
MNWSDWLPWAWYVVLLALLLCGLAVQLMGMPGLWVMVVSSFAYAWLTDWRYLATPGLITIVALALLGELIEFLAGASGAKTAGGSKRAMAGGIIGGITGGIVLTIPLLFVGTILGVCIGSFVGATLAQMTVARDVEHSTRIGLGAAKGTLIGILTKLSVGCVIFAITAIIALPLDAAPAPAQAGPAALPPTTQPAAPSTAPSTSPSSPLPDRSPPATLPAVERE